MLPGSRELPASRSLLIREATEYFKPFILRILDVVRTAVEICTSIFQGSVFPTDLREG